MNTERTEHRPPGITSHATPLSTPPPLSPGGTPFPLIPIPVKVDTHAYGCVIEDSTCFTYRRLGPAFFSPCLRPPVQHPSVSLRDT